MSRFLTVSMLAVTSFCAATVYADPGETWEVSTRTEAGSSGSLPETVMTLCLPPGGAKDPQQLLRQQGDCQVTDLKTAGKKTSWKVRCGSGDDELTGTGDVTYSSTSYQGGTRLAGKSGGEPVNMKLTYQGKRLGAACDTSAPPVIKGMEGLGEIMGLAKSQMTSAVAEQCEVANYQATELISPRFFGTNAACPGKEKFACKVIAKAVAKDPLAFGKLAKFEDTSDLGIAKICKIDMAAATKTNYAKVNGDNYQLLADFCPEEARAYGKEPAAPAGQGASAKPEDAPVSTIIDNAVKLKGFFGF